MSEAHDNRLVAARLPHADLIAVLFVQHARVKDLMAQVSAAAGTERTMLFEHLTATIKAYETAEEAVVRPITKEAAGSEVADARNAEEREADEVIAALTEMDVDSAEFDAKFAEFRQAVLDHAAAEETEEFPSLESSRSDEERVTLGEEFLARFRAAGGTD